MRQALTLNPTHSSRCCTLCLTTCRRQQSRQSWTTPIPPSCCLEHMSWMLCGASASLWWVCIYRGLWQWASSRHPQLLAHARLMEHQRHPQPIRLCFHCRLFHKVLCFKLWVVDQPPCKAARKGGDGCMYVFMNWVFVRPPNCARIRRCDPAFVPMT